MIRRAYQCPWRMPFSESEHKEKNLSNCKKLHLFWKKISQPRGKIQYVPRTLKYLCKRLLSTVKGIKLLPKENTLSSYPKICILCFISFRFFLSSFTFSSLCYTLSGRDWQERYIHAISPSARSYSLLEPSSTGQINLPCQREGALRGPISRWLGQGWEGWRVTAMGPSQAWLVSISSQPQGQLGAERQ